MTSPFKTLLAAAAVSAAFASGGALAAPPAILAGSTWNLQTNRDVVTLVITTQSGPGAPGAATCQIINGDIGNVAHIRGWYCAATGRIHFLHKNLGSANTVRVFTGNVSDDVPGQGLFMAGTMAIDDAAFGDYGEFNFSASQ